MRELVERIKANPGKYSYASAGAGTPAHLSAELLKLSFGLDLTHVPFRGAGPAVQSVVGGHNPIGCVTLPPVDGLIKGGQLRGLALTSASRFPSAPDIPTMAEAGISGQEGTTWQSLLVPAGTAPGVTAFLHEAISKAANAPGMKERFIELGFTPILNTPQQFAEQITVEVKKWSDVIRRAGLEQL